MTDRPKRGVLSFAMLAHTVAVLAMPLGVVRAAESEHENREWTGLPIVAISMTAPPAESEARLLDASGLALGAPYHPSDVRRAVKRLYELGRFENVVVRGRRTEGGVELEFILPPLPRVHDVRIETSDAVSRAEIESLVDLAQGDELESRKLVELRERLANALRRRGFRSPAIGLARERLGRSGATDILIRVDEGPETILRKVILEGHLAMPEPRLRELLALRTGEVLDVAAVERGIENLRGEYRARGYLDVRIDEPTFRESPTDAGGTPFADLLLSIHAGPKVAVSFHGNRRIATRDLSHETEVFETLGTGAPARAEIRERILARYEKLGYLRDGASRAADDPSLEAFEAKVRVEERASRDGAYKTIDVFIAEGVCPRVASVRFPGNTVFRSGELEAAIQAAFYELLGDELEEPGADPSVVAALLGDHSLEGPRDSPPPANTPPAPDRAAPFFGATRIAIYVDRVYRRAAGAIEDLYRSRGYQTASVDAPRLERRANRALIDVTLSIREGAVWTVGAFEFSGNRFFSTSELEEFVEASRTTTATGSFSYASIEHARRDVLRRYLDAGFSQASVVTRVVAMGSEGHVSSAATSTSTDGATYRACRMREERGATTCPVRVSVAIDEGPRIRTNRVVVRGMRATKSHVVRDELDVREGEILRETDMRSSETNLLRLGLFEKAKVDVLDPNQPATSKDVVVDVAERDFNAFALGWGVSTEEGLRARVEYSHANLFGRAMRFQTSAKANVQPDFALVVYNDAIRESIREFYDSFDGLERLERELAVGVTVPRPFRMPRGFVAGVDASYLRNNEPAFAREGFKVGLRASYDRLRPTFLGRPRPVALELVANIDRVDVVCNDRLTSSSTLAMSVRTSQLCTGDAGSRGGTSVYVGVGPRASWDLRDNAMDPHLGLYAEIQYELAMGLDHGSPNHTKLEGQVAGYLSYFGKGPVLAIELIGRRIFPLETGTVPVHRRYFAGGRSTVRGYPEQGLFPRDAALDPSGKLLGGESPAGTLFVALRTELRLPLFGPWSLAAFGDTGDLFQDASNFALDWNTPIGVGGGLRVATPVGPLALDVAFPVNPRVSGQRTALVHFGVSSF